MLRVISSESRLKPPFTLLNTFMLIAANIYPAHHEFTL
jgi:hypothetical protein